MQNRWARAISTASLLLVGCSSADPELGSIGEFTLTERNGQTISRTDLDRKIWVAAFIFTRCAGPCPRVTQSMAELHRFVGGSSDVTLVTFTVDPEFDTPEVLTRYANGWQAGERWLFLTGDREAIYRLIRQDFKLGVRASEGENRKPGYEVDHSTRLVVIDPQGRIRGYYDGTDPEAVARLKIDLAQLVWQYRLPAINAGLNSVCTVLLLLGYWAVRRRWIGLHKFCMLSAMLVSAAFLAAYLYFHFVVRGGEPTRFPGTGALRYIYLTVLLSHTVLAVVATPLALITAYLGLRERLPRHVRIARWTLPIWLYVSVTGVVVYWMLYRLYPPA